MKTIGYMDRAEGKTIFVYNPEHKQIQRSVFDLKAIDRIIQGLKELDHVGNIDIYLIKGNKFRKIATRYN